MVAAVELLLRGQRAARRGRHADARQLFETVLDVSDDPDVIARAEVARSFLDAEAGDVDRALAVCHRVWGDAALPEITRSRAAAQYAVLQFRRGQFEQALVGYESAVQGFAADNAELGRLLLNRGNVHLQLGRVAEARADHLAAREHLLAAGEEYDAAQAGWNAAYDDLLAGDIAGALQAMESLSPVLIAAGPISAAVAAQDHAEALFAAGLVDEAEAALDQAARAYGRRRLGQFQGEAELQRARTLLRKDNERAAATGRKAARIFRKRGAESFALRADLVVLTAQIQSGRRGQSLIIRGDELADELLAAGLRQDAVLARLQSIRVRIVRGDLVDAADRLRRIRVKGHDRLEVRLLAHELRAELAAARSQGGQVLRHVRVGLDELHAWQSNFGSLDLQSTLVGHGRTLAERGLAHARASGSPELMLEWSERARALVSRVSPVRPPRDPGLADRLSRLRLLLAGQPSPGSPAAAEIHALREDIRQRSWFGQGSGEVSEPAEAAEVCARLGRDDAALVAHVVVDDELVAVVATSDGVTTFELGSHGPIRAGLARLGADLTVAAAALPSGLHAVVRDGVDAQVQAIDDQLIAPLMQAIGDRRLVLTPSGALAGTPWTLLPHLRDRPVCQPRSATHWLRSGSAPPREKPLVGFVAGPWVPRAAEEVHRAAGAWRPAQVRHAPANAAEVVRLADEVDILHIAAHGRHATETPMFSGLEFSDGTFYGYDIDQVEAVPDVVLLSACEVGRGSVRAAEETVGMTAAWLHAGVRCVIASPVLISDEVASEVLGGVHEHLAAGRSPAESLVAAVNGAASMRSPAPLMCFGSGW